MPPIRDVTLVDDTLFKLFPEGGEFRLFVKFRVGEREPSVVKINHYMLGNGNAITPMAAAAVPAAPVAAGLTAIELEKWKFEQQLAHDKEMKQIEAAHEREMLQLKAMSRESRIVEPAQPAKTLAEQMKDNLEMLDAASRYLEHRGIGAASDAPAEEESKGFDWEFLVEKLAPAANSLAATVERVVAQRSGAPGAGVRPPGAARAPGSQPLRQPPAARPVGPVAAPPPPAANSMPPGAVKVEEKPSGVNQDERSRRAAGKETPPGGREGSKSKVQRPPGPKKPASAAPPPGASSAAS